MRRETFAKGISKRAFTLELLTGRRCAERISVREDRVVRLVSNLSVTYTSVPNRDRQRVGLLVAPSVFREAAVTRLLNPVPPKSSLVCF